MLDNKEAIAIVKKNLPNGVIDAYAPFGNDLLVFVVMGSADDPDGESDPYYSVNTKTKEFKEFSILEDTTPVELIKIFADSGVAINK